MTQPILGPSNGRCPLLVSDQSTKVCAPASCSLTQCAHNVSRACTLYTAPSEGNAEEIAALYSTTPDAVLKAAEAIEKAAVADAWMVHVCTEGALSASLVNFQEAADARQRTNFDSWNRSRFTHDDIVVTLYSLMQKRFPQS